MKYKKVKLRPPRGGWKKEKEERKAHTTAAMAAQAAVVCVCGIEIT